MMNWPNFVSQLFNGLALGALLALISSGLTIIYGTLGVLNLAHGAMFMLGGYAGYAAYTYTDSFVVAVIAGSLFVMILGIVMERVIIRHFYHRPHEDQLLVTFPRHLFCRNRPVHFFQPVADRAAAAASPGHYFARLHVLSDLSHRGRRHRRRRAGCAVHRALSDAARHDRAGGH
jgi:branched-subunit amino acid ABC-type transport system permease component